jgi:NAD(P)-dependent dehydrogenase (short-subunit alcohol dehydrogenase family)
MADKVAVVTGGGRGVGRATALALAHAGFTVAVLSRRSRLEEPAAMAALLRAPCAPCDVHADAVRIHAAAASALA